MAGIISDEITVFEVKSLFVTVLKGYKRTHNYLIVVALRLHMPTQPAFCLIAALSVTIVYIISKI